MTYLLLKFVHLLGAILIGAGLIGVWISDLRTRQFREINAFAEAVRNIAVFYDGIVVPGALLLLVSGTWMIVELNYPARLLSETILDQRHNSGSLPRDSNFSKLPKEESS
jgi:uncharacterized membrane protein